MPGSREPCKKEDFLLLANGCDLSTCYETFSEACEITLAYFNTCFTAYLGKMGDARNYFLVFLAHDKKKKKDLAKNDLYSRIVKLWKHWRITRRYLWIPAFHQLSKDYFVIRDKIHVSSFITFTYFIYHELKMHSVNLHPPPPNTNWGGWVGSFQNNWGHP